MKVKDGTEKRSRLLKLFADLYPGLADAKRFDGASIVDVLSFTDLLLVEGHAANARSTHADLRGQRALLDVAMNGVLQGRAARAPLELLGGWMLGIAGRTPTS